MAVDALAPRQDINSIGKDLVIPEYSSFSTIRVNAYILVNSSFTD